jgi:Tfp pilus assembly protein PilV
MSSRFTSSKGFSLAETVIALGVLTTGVVGAAGVFVAGMRNLSSSPADVVSAQKAAQAIEAVYSARDSGKLIWSQIRNVSAGGVFLDAAQPLKLAGPDGLVNTADDTTVETVALPGKDQTLGTSDDQYVTYTTFTRQITITDVSGENGDLRKIVVTITYQNGNSTRSYTLTTYISAFS